MGDNSKWLPEEEVYLRDLSKLCQDLSAKYKLYYELYKTRQTKFKIPAIVISSVTGLTSFGTSNFPEKYQKWVSIAVGASSLFIALLNSIESYMKIGETMSGCLQASISLQKLKEFIDIELSLPLDDRSSQGILFLRDCYSKYEKILDLSPSILKKVRFIRPSYDENIHTTITMKPVEQTSSEIEAKTGVTISEIIAEDRGEDSPYNRATTRNNAKAKTIFFA
jgi:hypothetical protein